MTRAAGVFVGLVGAAYLTLLALPHHEEKFLSAVTYNVLADEDEPRIQALLGILDECRADVIALQEVTDWFEDRLRVHPLMARYHIVRQGEYIILSRHRIASMLFETLPGEQRRGFIVAEIDVYGSIMAVGTMHMEAYLEDGPTRAKQLQRMFSVLASFDEAMLLGDFNFGDGEAESSSLDKAYVDAWTSTRPKEPGYTWNIETSHMARMGSFVGEPSRRIDRALIRSKTWEPSWASILGDSPITEDKKTFPSDHFGLMIWLKRARR